MSKRVPHHFQERSNNARAEPARRRSVKGLGEGARQNFAGHKK